ncbi:MAG: YbaB/EbfC family nucleoid-associated protein [Coprobacillus sp.]|nr:YbaB/EbfC family nucleoid-associated protein [Coprobacillus sp.]
MNYKQMMAQAQKLTRDLEKARSDLASQTFTKSKAGIVTVTMLGSKELVSVEIDPSVLNEEDKEMVEETIVLAINEVLEEINKKEEEIETKIAGKGGLPF